MRLGLRPTVFEPGTEGKGKSKARVLYGGAGKIWERHRHRYEVNPLYVERLEASGLRFTGKDEKGERMQILELLGKSWVSLLLRRLNAYRFVFLDHPFFMGLQAHPEFCTRPLNPSPPFLGFVAAASDSSVLAEQMAFQGTHFKPPHPEEAMIGEAQLRDAEIKLLDESGSTGVVLNGDS